MLFKLIQRWFFYLQILQPNAEAFNSFISIQHIPHQDIEASVSEETLMSQIVFLLQDKKNISFNKFLCILLVSDKHCVIYQ